MWDQELPTITGRCDKLRWLTSEDAPGILSVFGDPEVIRYCSSPVMDGLDAAGEKIEEIHALFESKQLYQRDICSNESDEVFGTCTFCDVNLTHRRAEVEIAIGGRAWGTGFGREALELLIGVAFDTLELHR